MSRSRIVVESGQSPVGKPDGVGFLDLNCDPRVRFLSTPDNQITINQSGHSVEVQLSTPQQPDRSVTITSITPNSNGGYNISGSGPPGLTITIRGRTLTIPSTGQFNLIGVMLPDGSTPITNSTGGVSGSIYMKGDNQSRYEVIIDAVYHHNDTEYRVIGRSSPLRDSSIYINDQLARVDRNAQIFAILTLNDDIDNNINYVTNEDGVNVGSFNVGDTDDENQVITILNIVSNTDGSYLVVGLIPHSYITATINGEICYVSDFDTFNVTTTLNEGENHIVYMGRNICTFKIKDGRLVP